MKPGLVILCLLAFMVFSCTKEDIVSNDSREEVITRALEEENVFYYYGYENKKIFLRQTKDKIFVTFAPEATRELFQAVER